MNIATTELTLAELDQEGGAHLPARELMQTIGVGLSVNVGVSLSVAGLPALPL